MNFQVKNQDFKDLSQDSLLSSYSSPQTETVVDDKKQSERNEVLSKQSKENLPILATANDVREVVRILKQKTTVIPMVEVLSFEPRRFFEARKILAYEYWGVIKRVDEGLSLTELGGKLASIGSSESYIFEEILASVPPYIAVIELINQNSLKVITHHDVIEYWRQSFDKTTSEFFDSHNSEAEVVSFFSICHAAELGIATVGKRGQPARLRIQPSRVQDFLAKKKENASNHSALNLFDEILSTSDKNTFQKSASVLQNVYISAEQPDEPVKDLFNVLDLADFNSVFSTNLDNKDYLQSDRLVTMQSCQAGVIVITNKDCSVSPTGETEITSERLTEIIIAIAIYNWRVIIIWKSTLPPSKHLQNYKLNLLIGNESDFVTNYKTVKLLKSMRNI